MLQMVYSRSIRRVLVEKYPATMIRDIGTFEQNRRSFTEDMLALERTVREADTEE